MGSRTVLPIDLPAQIRIVLRIRPSVYRSRFKKRGNMKSFRGYLYGILVFVLLTSLTACGMVPAGPAATIAPASTAAPAATAAATIPPGDSTRKLTVDGLERSYLVHIPRGLDRSRPVPVLFAFHGADMAPEEMQLVTGFNEIADKDKFIVVYPEGIGQSWNVRLCCGEAADKNVNDPAFIRQIVSDLESFTRLDPKRIYAMGFSNGGAFVYRVACEMSDVFAGIAPVAGGMVFRPCQPKQPISLLIVHGLDDTTLPYTGGGQSNVPPVEQIIDDWMKLDGCTGAAQVDYPMKIVKHSVYGSCQSGTAVELYAIDKLGHDWPPKEILPVSQIVWDFFVAHPKQ